MVQIHDFQVDIGKYRLPLNSFQFWLLIAQLYQCKDQKAKQIYYIYWKIYQHRAHLFVCQQIDLNFVELSYVPLEFNKNNCN